MVVLWNAGYIISSMHNIDPALAEKAVGYLRALLWGAPGYLFFQVARNQCEGLAKTKPGMVMGFIGLLVNIPVNYIFIYGLWHAGAGRRRLRRGDGIGLLGDVFQHALLGAPRAFNARYSSPSASANRISPSSSVWYSWAADCAGAVFRSDAVCRRRAAGLPAGDR
jgi:hypothetical protein